MRLGSAVALIGAALLALVPAPLATQAGQAHFVQSYRWQMPQPWFGGFSAIEIQDDGRAMIVLSDRSRILSARLRRQDGRITGVEVTGMHRLLSSTMKPLGGRAGDSEGLASLPDGRFCVSFEGVHRVACYDRPDGRSRVLDRPQAFRDLQRNGSFEALAVDGRGWLYTLPENGLTREGRIPVYRWNGRRWSSPFSLSATDGLLPVGADFGPDGRFYLLERGTSAFGFRSRLRRWTLDAGAAIAEEVLFHSAVGTHDNLEGLSVWRDARGQLRATMVSDDNFLFLQRTEIVEYTLPE